MNALILEQGHPAAAVTDRDFWRLLGYPAHHAPQGAAIELITEARSWYLREGRPWTHTRRLLINSLDATSVQLSNGVVLSSPALCQRLRRARAHMVVIAAASAGPEVDEEVARRWQDGRPDEAYTLGIFASVMTETLTRSVGLQLCEEVEPGGGAVVPHYSPGYPGWNLDDQKILLDLLQTSGDVLPGPLEVLSSAMLRPKSSQLAVFGLTRHARSLGHGAHRLQTPCTSCDHAPCQYRRAPHRPLTEPVVGEQLPAGAGTVYAFPEKALNRWAKELLDVSHQDGGVVQGRFRFQGGTCGNGGTPLSYVFAVELKRTEAGYRIEASACYPESNDSGHRAMCAYVKNPGGFTSTVEHFRPLVGGTLDEALAWKPSTSPAGCLCTTDSLNHKWRMVFQTLHFKLNHTKAGER